MTSAAFARALHAEVRQWHAEGLVSDAVAAALYERYPAGDGGRASRQWWVTLLATLGAALMGTGVIVLVASNLQSVPGSLKLALLLGFMTACYATAYHLRVKAGRHRLGTALFLLGSFTYGAVVFFVGQAFHLEPDAPLLPLTWAAGVMTLAFALRSRSILHLALFGLLAAFVAQMQSIIAGETLALYAITIMAGLGAYAAGEWTRAGRARALSGPFAVWGAPLVLTSAYLASFTYPWVGPADPMPGAAQGHALVATAVGVVAVVVAWLTAKRAADRSAALALLAPLTLAVLMLWAPQALVTPGSGRYPPGAAVANVLAFAMSIGLLHLGEARRQSGLANWGLVFLGALTFTRYVDVAQGLLGTALLFLTSGALLLVLGWWLDRRRRAPGRESRGA